MRNDAAMSDAWAVIRYGWRSFWRWFARNFLSIVFTLGILGTLAFFVIAIVWMFISEATEQDRQDAFRRACVEENGTPAYDTDIGDICVNVDTVIETDE